ncbi:MAG: GDSL-type esterase/lipase family protein [Planctomycetota bacterium]
MSRLPPFPHPLLVEGRLIRHDPELGHAFVAGVHRRVPHEHGAYFAATNAQGFREDHDFDRAPTGFRVQVYGDSYAAGDGVDNDQRFSALLAAQLGVVVANVAVPGHGPDQNVLQLEAGALSRPDLILWCIAVHTLDRVQETQRISVDRDGRMWRLGRPHFVLDEHGGLCLRGVPVPEQGEAIVEPALAPIEGVWAARRRELVARLRRQAVAMVGAWLKPPPDPDYADATSSGFRLLAALVRRFHAAAAGTPVAIVPLPTSRYVADRCAPVFQQRFAELAAPERGLLVLDVVDALRRAPRARRAGMHYRLDGHFTVDGHQAVAQALAAQLQAHALVPAAAPIEVVTQARRTDLELHVGWQLHDGHATLLDASGAALATRREQQLSCACRAGVVPLSAVHACLDEGRVAGPELRRLVLHPPCAVGELLRMVGDRRQWTALASGFVRWFGAAEQDLRRFLCYRGPIEWRESEAPFEAVVDATRLAVDDDRESAWLRDRLQPLLGERDAAALTRRLRRLGRLWELATRAARETVLPTTAPLRRGRVLRQLAAAAR